MCVCELGLDNREREVEPEEGTYYNERDKEDDCTHVHRLPERVHDEAPALERHTLEDGDYGVENIVEVIHAAC